MLYQISSLVFIRITLLFQYIKQNAAHDLSTYIDLFSFSQVGPGSFSPFIPGLFYIKIAVLNAFEQIILDFD